MTIKDKAAAGRFCSTRLLRPARGTGIHSAIARRGRRGAVGRPSHRRTDHRHRPPPMYRRKSIDSLASMPAGANFGDPTQGHRPFPVSRPKWQSITNIDLRISPFPPRHDGVRGRDHSRYNSKTFAGVGALDNPSASDPLFALTGSAGRGHPNSATEHYRVWSGGKKCHRRILLEAMYSRTATQSPAFPRTDGDPSASALSAQFLTREPVPDAALSVLFRNNRYG